MEDQKHDLPWLNSLGASEATEEFLKCCGSRNWATQMAKSRPFASLDQLSSRAVEIWWTLETVDWLESFRSHPKIGVKKTANEVSSQSRFVFTDRNGTMAIEVTRVPGIRTRWADRADGREGYSIPVADGT